MKSVLLSNKDVYRITYSKYDKQKLGYKEVNKLGHYLLLIVMLNVHLLHFENVIPLLDMTLLTNISFS